VKTDTTVSVSNHDISIAQCAAADFDEVFSLLEQLWPNTSLDRDALRALFSDAIPAGSRVLLCARRDGKVVGFGSMTLKTHLWHGGLIAWVDELVVDLQCRGHGIGRRLLDRLVTRAREKGCRAMELDSAFHRIEAHAFYEKLGFEKRAFLFSKNIAG
jgi:glucosamine-phosphate N-acetyltransferase